MDNAQARNSAPRPANQTQAELEDVKHRTEASVCNAQARKSAPRQTNQTQAELEDAKQRA